MKAYNQTWIENLDFQSVIKNWHEKKLITDQQFEAAKSELLIEFYRPNWFIRIGLFIFTTIVCSFATSFFSLFFMYFESQVAFGFLAFLSGIAFIFFLEFFIKNRRVYRSGLDNALLYGAIGAFYSSFLLISGFEMPSQAYPLLLLFILIPALLRYGDPIVAFVSFISFFAFIFLSCTNFSVGKLILPFVMMVLSFAIYFISKKTKKDSYYTDCQTIIETLALILLYLSGNYLVVREANAMLNAVSPSVEIEFSWLFWIFTFAIPLIFIFLGAKFKEKKFLLIGLLALGFSIYTYRFYHEIMPIEWAFSIGGVVFIIFSVWAIRYFRTEKYCLIYEEDKSDKLKNFEAFVFSQATQSNSQPNEMKFGGGDFGGGGAGTSI